MSMLSRGRLPVMSANNARPSFGGWVSAGPLRPSGQDPQGIRMGVRETLPFGFRPMLELHQAGHVKAVQKWPPVEAYGLRLLAVCEGRLEPPEIHVDLGRIEPQEAGGGDDHRSGHDAPE